MVALPFASESVSKSPFSVLLLCGGHAKYFVFASRDSSCSISVIKLTGRKLVALEQEAAGAAVLREARTSQVHRSETESVVTSARKY